VPRCSTGSFCRSGRAQGRGSRPSSGRPLGVAGGELGLRVGDLVGQTGAGAEALHGLAQRRQLVLSAGCVRPATTARTGDPSAVFRSVSASNIRDFRGNAPRAGRLGDAAGMETDQDRIVERQQHLAAIAEDFRAQDRTVLARLTAVHCTIRRSPGSCSTPTSGACGSRRKPTGSAPRSNRLGRRSRCYATCRLTSGPPLRTSSRSCIGDIDNQWSGIGRLRDVKDDLAGPPGTPSKRERGASRCRWRVRSTPAGAARFSLAAPTGVGQRLVQAVFFWRSRRFHAGPMCCSAAGAGLLGGVEHAEGGRVGVAQLMPGRRVKITQPLEGADCRRTLSALLVDSSFLQE
jgi:hypothetical protein